MKLNVWMLKNQILFIVRIYSIFSYNTDIEGVEFASVHFLQLLKLKGHLYSDPSQFPYLLVVYTPLYYYVMLFVVNLFSIDVVKDIHSMYITGRVVSFVLLFLDFYILVNSINLLVSRFRYKIYLFLLLLLFIPVHFYTFRPDSFKVTCFVLFLYFSIKYVNSNSFKHLFIGFLFLLTGVLFKQDLLLYGIILYVTFYIGFRKRIYLVSVCLLISVLLAIIYIVYLWSGINFYKTLFLYNVQYDSDFHLNIRLILWYVIRVIPLMVLMFFNLSSRNRFTSVLALLSIFYFWATNLSMLRMGSNMNYTYESSILLLLNGIIYFKERDLILIAHHVYVIFLAITFTGFLPFWVNWRMEKIYKTEYINNKKAATKIQSVVKNNILFLPNQKEYIFYPKSNLIYGYDWHYDRYCELNLTIRLKPKFAKNDIVNKYDENFKNGIVQYIVLGNGKKSVEHMAKYYPRFILKEQVENFLIYQFK